MANEIKFTFSVETIINIVILRITSLSNELNLGNQIILFKSILIHFVLYCVFRERKKKTRSPQKILFLMAVREAGQTKASGKDLESLFSTGTCRHHKVTIKPP